MNVLAKTVSAGKRSTFTEDPVPTPTQPTAPAFIPASYPLGISKPANRDKAPAFIAASYPLGIEPKLTTSAPQLVSETELTDGFHLVIAALKLNGIDTIYGVPGIPITDL
ncbi:MAG: hypothetical protein ABW099_14130, partial [Candidatus Binatia bacterium]